MSRWGLWMSAAALCALSVAGCKKPTTGLRVMVTTDFVPSSTMPQLHSVRLRVTNLQTGAELAEETVNVVDGTVSLPLKFSVFLVGAPNERVRIEAEGHTVESQASGMFEGRPGPITAARMVTGFVEGQIRVVPLVLYRGCWDRRLACEPNTTCSASAACESASRDANTLPSYDRDAGDPSDVFEIPMDASAPDGAVDSGVDAMMPPGDAMMPPGDAGLCPFNGAAPTLEVTDIAGSETIDPTLFDVTLHQAPQTLMMNSAQLELAWAAPSMMMRLAYSARVNSAGMVVRTRESSGRSISPATLQWLQPVRFGAGVSVFGLSVDMTGSLGLNTAVIDAINGLSTPVNGWNAVMGWGMGDVSSPAHSAIATIGGNTPNSTLACYTTTRGSLRCFRNTLVGGSGAPMPGMPFDVTTTAGPLGRLLGLAEGGPNQLQFAAETADRTGVAICSFSVAGTPADPTMATCAVARTPMSAPIVAGTASAAWASAGMCVNNEQSWYVSLIASTPGGPRLLAGRLAGSTPGFIATINEVASGMDQRTAISVSPSQCEMLVVASANDSADFRRVRVTDGQVGLRFTQRMAAGSPVKLVPQAPSATMGDQHMGAFINASGALSAFRVRASCGGLMM